MYKYLLERIRDGRDWKKGMRIWADAPCTGWRVIRKEKVKIQQLDKGSQENKHLAAYFITRKRGNELCTILQKMKWKLLKTT